MSLKLTLHYYFLFQCYECQTSTLHDYILFYHSFQEVCQGQEITGHLIQQTDFAHSDSHLLQQILNDRGNIACSLPSCLPKKQCLSWILSSTSVT